MQQAFKCDLLYLDSFYYKYILELGKFKPLYQIYV